MSDVRPSDPSGGGSHPATVSSTLLVRARSRQPEAWRQLSRLHGPQVYRWARRAGLQADDAADILQEVFQAIWASLDGFRRDRPDDSFRGWLWTITRNKVRDHFRRLARSPRAIGGTTAKQALAEMADVPLEEPPESARQTRVELHRGVLQLIRDQFTPTTWQAFWQATTTERTSAEIAEELGISKKAVRQAKFRVVRRLREELADLN